MNPHRSRPRFGFVVPSYNQGWALRDALESLLSEAREHDLQIGVMDGASGDESSSIIAEYADRLDFAVSAPDAGQADAINKGLARIDADWVGWLNADDYLLPGAVAAFTRGIAAASADDVAVVGQARAVDRARRPLYHQPSRVGSPAAIARWTFDSAWFPQPAVVFRRSAFTAVGGLDPQLHNVLDLDLWLRLAETGAFRSIPELVAEYRVYPEAKTSANVPRREAEHIYALFHRGHPEWAASRMPTATRAMLDHDPARRDWYLESCRGRDLLRALLGRCRRPRGRRSS